MRAASIRGITFAACASAIYVLSNGNKNDSIKEPAMPYSRNHSILRCLRLAAFAHGLMLTASTHAQDPLKLLPNNYRLVFDNKDVAVIRAHYGPHEKISVHDHTSYSTVFVYLSNSGPVRIDHQEPGEPPSSVTRPPTVTGAYRVAPGINERHSIENLSGASSEFLRIELKKVKLDLKEPFRGKAPTSLSALSDTVEFSSHALEVERVICSSQPSCALQASPSPSLLVAFTPLSIASTDSEVDHRIQAGTVYWLPASHTATVVPIPGENAHMLRILLPEAASR